MICRCIKSFYLVCKYVLTEIIKIVKDFDMICVCNRNINNNYNMIVSSYYVDYFFYPEIDTCTSIVIASFKTDPVIYINNLMIWPLKKQVLVCSLGLETKTVAHKWHEMRTTVKWMREDKNGDVWISNIFQAVSYVITI